jgi:outer membrane protein OmpA-like peptidoglycan-associated protein
MTNTKIIQFLAKGFSLLLILFFLNIGKLYAQGFEYKGSARLAKSLAEYADKEGDTYTAIDYYEYYLNRKSSKTKVKFKLAMLYYEIRDYKKASLLLKEIKKENEKKYPLAVFYLAQINKTLGQYDIAKSELERFNKLYKNGKEKRTYKKLSKLSIVGCDLSKQLTDSVINVEIKRLDPSINSRHIEQSPFMIDEGQLIFASNHADKLEYFKEFEKHKKPKRELVIATKQNNIWKYQESVACKDTISDILNLTLSYDKKKAYFNKCRENQNGKIICKLYEGKYKDGKLTKTKALPEHVNIPNYSITMPSASYDNEKGKEIIYFASNLPKSRGGMDIWYFTYSKKRNKYSKPKNAGNKINTVGNEISPYVDKNTGALYFSSDAWPGVGGYDIFKTYGSYRKWISPENIGMPINSGYDDLYYTVNPDQETGFFTSNRPGGESLRSETCCDDIFEYNYNAIKSFNVKGRLFVQNSDDVDLILRRLMGKYDESKMLANTDVSVYIIDPETKDTIYISTFRPDADGNFDIKLDKGKSYKILLSNSNINPKSFIVDTRELDPNINNIIDKGSVGIEAVPSDTIKINVFYEFNSFNLNEESKNSLNEVASLMEKLPQISLIVSSHTDSKGSDDYNKKLSQKRADKIKTYLIQRGVSKDRIEAIGYGESQPIAPNQKPDGSDNPEGRKKNRRTEVKFAKPEALNEIDQ